MNAGIVRDACQHLTTDHNHHKIETGTEVVDLTMHHGSLCAIFSWKAYICNFLHTFVDSRTVLCTAAGHVMTANDCNVHLQAEADS